MSLTANTPTAQRSVEPIESAAHPTTVPNVKNFVRSATLFTLIGFLIYLGLYVGSEQLVNTYAKRNRFFTIKNAPRADYNYVILGASHAAALDYEDMTARLEQMTGSKIINLSEVGSGVVVNRLVLDYFWVNHRTQNVVYVIDSFAFYSRQWNEDRLNDTRLFDRAPFDPALAQILLQNPAGRAAVLNYVTGFSKINNADRFKLDISDDEATKFQKTYRPIPQIDNQRFEYLYPKEIDPAVFQHYLVEFENLMRDLKQRNIRVLVIKPPVPARFYKMLPGEAQFDDSLKGILQKQAIEFHDFSLVGNDDKFFFNTDHLNRSGVLNFYENYLKGLLVPAQ